MRTYPNSSPAHLRALTTSSLGTVEARSGLTGLPKKKLSSKNQKHSAVSASQSGTPYARRHSLNAPTDIALTFADYIDSKNTEGMRFEQAHEQTLGLIAEIESGHRGIAYRSSRQGSWPHRGIIDRRQW